MFILYENREEESYWYSEMVMIFYYDDKLLKFFIANDKSVRKKDVQFELCCKNIAKVISYYYSIIAKSCVLRICRSRVPKPDQVFLILLVSVQLIAITSFHD